ncbi:cellulase family glycosylhydrolase [Allonocardiopsis opalescens]|uniref:Endoglucanase n=1 Tax=Allonocardiopsis opalescens TaxID=1144618 RepID=A0A2T0PZ77_9ACTN|nr:cellulase family glycosylhydrolase [Allonocardiopsis opalescens]PRX96820.1 mannan endo-1,4-beta-mannosidase [Allonocardiopsis opalescens]
MRTRIAIASSALLALVFSLLAFALPAQAETGFHVNNGRLYDANGNEFIMRGVSHPHAWYAGETGSFAEIKSFGANTVRVVLSSGHRWTRNDTADVANVISLCRANRLICVLEVHDTTGYGDEGAAATLDQAVDYWISIQSAMQGQEDYVILNIGNEPFGNNASVNANWASATSSAIDRLRDAGFDHTIMVDAPNWGQDWSFTMRDNAQAVFNSDPDRNTVFSVHMYGVFDTAAEVNSYLNSFRSRNLPIVVGEFGHNHSDGDPDENTIMSTTRSLGIGWIGWSYSGNGGGVEYLDMVQNFNPANVTDWGRRIFTGTDGLSQTSREASVYGGGPDPSPSPTDPTTPPTGGCTASYAVVGQWSSGFQAAVTVTAGDAPISGWQVTWTYANGQSISSSWSANVTSSGSRVTATNVNYNGSLAAGASTQFGFLGSWNGSNSVPSVSCAVR